MQSEHRHTFNSKAGIKIDDRVDLGPEKFDDLFDFVLRAEEPPLQIAEGVANQRASILIGRRTDHFPFQPADRFALGNENILAWVEEIFRVWHTLYF